MSISIPFQGNCISHGNDHTFVLHHLEVRGLGLQYVSKVVLVKGKGNEKILIHII